MKRILFVDDDPRILDGLRRMLRQQRHTWQMVFTDGGQQALDEMAKAPFDVVVSDMRMPGVDGATLLQRVKEEYGGTVRIVLSGHAEFEAALRAVPVAHQFLAKPCSADTIREVIDRACCLQALFEDDLLRRTVARIDCLPSMPDTYQQLTVALVDPEVATEVISEIVQSDPALCAKVLQIVNSGFFGLARSVSSVKDAISYLGMSMLTSLALSEGVFSSAASVDAELFSMDDARRHAGLTAAIARELVGGRREREDAFLASLLHDLGKLVLATELPDIFDEVAVQATSAGTAFHRVERTLHGVTHAEIGGYLLGIWGLPLTITDAVSNHHNPARSEAQRFDVLGAVHVADALVGELGGSGAAPGLDEEFLAGVGALDSLPAWRELAASVAERRQTEAVS